MKTLDSLVLAQLCPLVRTSVDPLHFAYQPRIGVEVTAIFILESTLPPQKANSSVPGYWTNCPQFVRRLDCVFSMDVCSTGALRKWSWLHSTYPLHRRLPVQFSTLQNVSHTNTLYKKDQSRLHLLKRLRFFLGATAIELS